MGLYYYLFYTSFVSMPIILLLILLTQQRCRIWAKRGVKATEDIARNIASIELALKKYHKDMDSYIGRKIEEFRTETTEGIEDTIRKVVDGILCPGPVEVKLEDLEFLDNKLENPVEDVPLMAFESENANKQAMDESQLNTLLDNYVMDYPHPSDAKFLGAGCKRVYLSADLSAKLDKLTFVLEEPVTVSAILDNILIQHYHKYQKEIDVLCEIGKKNKNTFRHGRY